MKVMVALGTRPEVIKLAPLIAALRGRVELVICSTGQHREMLSQALEAFGICPTISLDTMSPGQSLNILSSRIMFQMDEVLVRERPDWILVQGDTTTALCCGLAAFHLGIQIGHVEAGLRTGDLANPFPEEANRTLLTRIASRHFAPTGLARDCLLSEGIQRQHVVVTGNTVVDAIVQAEKAVQQLDPSIPDVVRTLSDAKPVVLVTCHRRENFGGMIDGICNMLKDLCARYPDHQWVFPVHLNPAVQEPVLRLLGDIHNLLLLPPVSYQTSLYLISRSQLIVSDSGGIQEEAPYFGVPVVVMRTHTERREGIDAGFATLAGQSVERIAQAVIYWLDHPEQGASLKNRANPYGDGHAAERIVASLLGEEFQEFHG